MVVVFVVVVFVVVVVALVLVVVVALLHVVAAVASPVIIATIGDSKAAAQEPEIGKVPACLFSVSLSLLLSLSFPLSFLNLENKLFH